MDIDNNKVDVNTQSKFQNLLNILVRAISGSSKDSNVVEVEDHSGTHQAGDKTIFQPSSEPAISVVTEEEKEISETHLESNNPKVSIKEDLHADVVSDNLDQAVPVVAEETSAHQEENETIFQPSLEPAISVVTEEEKEISETHLESDNPKVSKEEDLHADVVSDNLDQAASVVTKEEVSGQNLLEILVRAISGSSKDSNVVEVEDHFGTHQEGDKTISQPSSEPAISVVTEEENEISETHLESDNLKVSKEEDLHADVVSDNLDQAVPVVAEETSAHQEENETISQPSLEPAISVVTEETSAHQEENETISQPSSEPAISVVTEEENEISETHLES
ncbi:hypothetical protein, partial [Ehrlichia muris]|uniref:hypothetical protein n=1 Tax=Ehrlichia muris TaxID=35795 RepID=UPI0037C0C7FD